MTATVILVIHLMSLVVLFAIDVLAIALLVSNWNRISRLGRMATAYLIITTVACTVGVVISIAAFASGQ